MVGVTITYTDPRRRAEQEARRNDLQTRAGLPEGEITNKLAAFLDEGGNMVASVVIKKISVNEQEDRLSAEASFQGMLGRLISGKPELVWDGKNWLMRLSAANISITEFYRGKIRLIRFDP